MARVEGLRLRLGLYGLKIKIWVELIMCVEINVSYRRLGVQLWIVGLIGTCSNVLQKYLKVAHISLVMVICEEFSGLLPISALIVLLAWI